MKYEDVEDGKEYSVGDIGNYYGGLSVKKSGNAFYWSIENWDGQCWCEISEDLFRVLIEQECCDD